MVAPIPPRPVKDWGPYVPTWLEHAWTQLGKSKVTYDPFQYMHVRGIFPNTFYHEMLSNLPIHGMEAINPKLPQRLYSYLTQPDKLPEFWKAFAEELFKPLLADKIVDLFGLPKPSFLDAQVIHDRPGYKLGIHTDGPEKLVTCLFYLPSTRSHLREGTKLYISKSGFESNGKMDHPLTDDFVQKENIPYEPNSALFFPRTNWSFHGVDQTPADRWLISYDLLR